MDVASVDGDSSGELSSGDQSLSDLASAVCNTLSGKQSAEENDVCCEVLDSEQIMHFMEKSIEDITAVIQESFTVTRLLLTFFHWDQQQLLERFYGSDSRDLFKEVKIHKLTAGLSSENTSLQSAERRIRSADCSICYSLTHSRDLFGLVCGHEFCLQCWDDYITHNIVDEGIALMITCPASNCDALVHDSTVMHLISDPKVKRKYRQIICNSFVSCNKLLRWCPAPNCGRAVKVESPSMRLVVCSCGEKFCFQCGGVWHDPIPCSWFQKWKQKCDKDSTTSRWIATNTKECPKCRATIEKDGGCNHMVCRSINCMHEFCWVCLGPWQDHGQNAWYNCNRYNEESSQKARSGMEKNRAALLRFLHYHERYSNHQHSLKFERVIHENVSSKISDIRKYQGRGWNEVKFLETAVKTLCQCRRTLMNTYVFAYFAVQNNQVLLFEENQRDLECATEQFSEYLERDIYRKDADDMKQKIIDKANYCTKRCEVLTSHIKEGYENNCWQIRE